MGTTRWMVVGVDGSQRSLDAVDWAAAEAAERGMALRVCHVDGNAQGGAADQPEGGGLAERVLATAADRAHQTAPDVPVERVTLSGHPAEALVTAAAASEALVLGARGGGGFASLLLGSVSEQCATHATCPVVVTRGVRRVGPIAVGVDGSPESHAALGFAFERAADLGVPVRVVHAHAVSATVPLFGNVPGGVMPGTAVEQLQAAARQTLDAAVRTWTSRYPDVRVVPRLVEDLASIALVNESEDCGLLAVGNRGHGGFAGLLLGSVSRHVLRHAECPVAVLRF